MTVNINRQTLVRALTLGAVLLIALHSIVLVIYFQIGDPTRFDFIRLIDLDYEGNIPTLFSSLLFLLNGGLFYLAFTDTRQAGRKFASYWLGLAIIFIFLGFDEGTRLHEEIGDLFENIVVAEGLLYFPWVIPYSIAFVLLTILYLRFYLSLSRDLQIRLALCAVVFLSGAIGVEIFSAREAETAGTSSISYSILYTIEESLEMAGLILLVDTLLRRLARQPGNFQFTVNG